MPAGGGVNRLGLGTDGGGHGNWQWVQLWRRKWQPTPVFFPGEFHGQRSLAGYSPWGGQESDRTERLSLNSGCFLDSETLVTTAGAGAGNLRHLLRIHWDSSVTPAK